MCFYDLYRESFTLGHNLGESLTFDSRRLHARSVRFHGWMCLSSLQPA